MFGVGMASQSMINSLKNNSRKRVRKKFFDRENRLDIKKRKKSLCIQKKDLPIEEQFSIKTKLFKQRKKERNKNIIIFGASIIITIILLKILFTPFKEALY